MKLIKTQEGTKFVYSVIADDGRVLATRKSSRSYVAATANGEYFFGRSGLVGKGEHGKMLRHLNLVLKLRS